jgi:hypothetical protein
MPNLPRLEIGGSANDEPIVFWFGQGYAFGWNNPDGELQLPLVVSDESLEAYKLGAGLGHDKAIAERAALQPGFDGPSVGPDSGGEDFQHFEARLREQLEALFHQHMPHIEAEGTPEVPPFDFTAVE